jgi:16S rRNA (guanine966-N2)-methyltransferase
MHAIDLFAGTGALALEAISRGAVRATLLERHFPTAKVIEQNIAALAVGEIARVIAADTFVWARALPDLGTERWLVFCSPPYRFYQERLAEMLELVGTFLHKAPPASIVVVEADRGLEISRLPQAPLWTVRAYPPAVIAIHRSPAEPDRL